MGADTTVNRLAVLAGAPGRARILEQAHRLFLEQGYAAVSMQQIADAAGVNKATLYHHFRDKEDLFLAVYGAELARIEDAVSAAVSGEGTLRERLQRVAAWFLAAPIWDVGRLMAELKRHVDEERRAELLRRVHFPWEVLLPVLQDASDELSADPELVAELFFGMLLSQARRAKLNQQPPPPGLPRTIVDILLDGAGAGESRATHALPLPPPPQPPQ
ncbi:MAG TPA: helix-turn-helix domain-containing protein [Thermomicrobiaceae bacterium]|nr:helix-turn-helix domain-containing protein [Thermomicrobiaceae bacterium]